MSQFFRTGIVFASLLLFTSGCFTQVGVTNRLAPGMSGAQVQNIMGPPSQTQFVADKWVWKYSLHQPWKGFVPYYLVFNKDSQALEGWVANEAEYQQQQILWMQTWNQLNQTFPPKQKSKVEVIIKRK
jgi:hypothetical protein